MHPSWHCQDFMPFHSQIVDAYSTSRSQECSTTPRVASSLPSGPMIAVLCTQRLMLSKQVVQHNGVTEKFSALTYSQGTCFAMQVQAATQSTDHVQWAVAQALGLQHNQVNVTCRRAGGGFGGKFSRSCPVAAAVAVAAHKLRRQVLLISFLEAQTPSPGVEIQQGTFYTLAVKSTAVYECARILRLPHCGSRRGCRSQTEATGALSCSVYLLWSSRRLTLALQK